jgi:hypothetical protein
MWQIQLTIQQPDHLQCHVLHRKSTYVSEEYISSISKVGDYAKHEIREKALLTTSFLAAFFLRLFFDPKDGDDVFLRNVS